MSTNTRVLLLAEPSVRGFVVRLQMEDRRYKRHIPCITKFTTPQDYYMYKQYTTEPISQLKVLYEGRQ